MKIMLNAQLAALWVVPLLIKYHFTLVWYSAKMEEGTLNRTVASTNMNATSSRAHTIVGINFIQKSKNAAGKEMAKGAIVNLVDLAGR